MSTHNKEARPDGVVLDAVYNWKQMYAKLVNYTHVKWRGLEDFIFTWTNQERRV